MPAPPREKPSLLIALQAISCTMLRSAPGRRSGCAAMTFSNVSLVMIWTLEAVLGTGLPDRGNPTRTCSMKHCPSANSSRRSSPGPSTRMEPCNTNTAAPSGSGAPDASEAQEPAGVRYRSVYRFAR